MTETVLPPEAAIPTGTAPAEDGAWGRFDRWASLGLTIVGVLGVVAVAVLASLMPGGSPMVVSVIALACQAALAALAFGVAIALVGSAPWARQAATWLLLLTAVAGGIGALLDLARGQLTIPIAAIVATWILALRPGPVPGLDVRARRRATAIGIAALLVVGLPPVITWAATNPASPLVATEDDLAWQLEVLCDRDDPLAMPDRVIATLRWSWLEHDVFGGAADAAGIGWPTPGQAGDESPWTVSAHSSSGPEIWPGGMGPSVAAVERELVTGGFLTWGVDGDPAPDGWVRLELVPSSAARAAQHANGELFLRGSYAHLDRWSTSTTNGCEW